MTYATCFPLLDRDCSCRQYSSYNTLGSTYTAGLRHRSWARYPRGSKRPGQSFRYPIESRDSSDHKTTKRRARPGHPDVNDENMTTLISSALPPTGPSPARNPFARPKLPSASSFTRTSLLPSHVSPKKTQLHSVTTPADRVDASVKGTSSVGKDRKSWRLLWRGGLEVGDSGYRLEGMSCIEDRGEDPDKARHHVLCDARFPFHSLSLSGKCEPFRFHLSPANDTFKRDIAIRPTNSRYRLMSISRIDAREEIPSSKGTHRASSRGNIGGRYR